MRCCWNTWRAARCSPPIDPAALPQDCPPMPDDQPLPSALLDRLAALLGPRGILTDPADLARILVRLAGALYRPHPPACCARPAPPKWPRAVAALRTPPAPRWFPQGGNTSQWSAAPRRMRGGGRSSISTRHGEPGARQSTRSTMTMTAEAGVIAEEAAQDAAAARAGRLFPASPRQTEGTCRHRRQPVDQRRRRAVSATAWRASWCSGWRWCWRTAGSGTACARCARTIPATI